MGMEAEQVRAKSERTYAAWREALERRTDACFQKAREGWTLGQVCDHVTRASGIFLDGAEALARGEGERRGGNLMSFLFFGVFRGLPPGRFKVPTNLPEKFQVLAKPEPMERDAAREAFEALAKRTDAVCATIGAADEKLRSKHPAAGWLTATQWYQLAEMHARHHLRQLKRIEKALDG